MVPAEAEVHVYCHSPIKGAEKRKMCKAGCIGCGKCSRMLPDAVKMDGFLAQVDYESVTVLDQEAVSAVKCPVGCLLTADERLTAAYNKLEGRGDE